MRGSLPEVLILFLGVCRGWMKAIKNGFSQRHLANSFLLHPPAMWPLAAWLGSDPRLHAPMSWPQLPLSMAEATTYVVSEASVP